MLYRFSGAEKFFEQEEGAENIKYKFRFAQKWPIICINHSAGARPFKLGGPNFKVGGPKFLLILALEACRTFA